MGAAAPVSSPICFNVTDLAAQPLTSSNFKISTYDARNRFGKQLWEMKRIIQNSTAFRNDDERRLCLAIAMQVRRVRCPPHHNLWSTYWFGTG